MMALLGSVSAYLRLSAAGLGCVPWPACYQERSAPLERQHHPVARLTHRALAAGLGILVVVIALAAAAMRPRRAAVMWAALLALGLTVLLAILGRATPTATGAGVAAANLLGGMAMAALLWWLALHATPARARAHERLQWPAITMLALVLLQVLLGALISTNRAALACPTLPLCAEAHGGVPAALHVAHRILAGALVLAAGVVATIYARSGGGRFRLAIALAALVVVQAAAGAMMVGSGFPLGLALVHHAGALLLLLAAVWMLSA